MNPDIEHQKVRTGEVLRVLDDVLKSMRADVAHMNA